MYIVQLLEQYVYCSRRTCVAGVLEEYTYCRDRMYTTRISLWLLTYKYPHLTCRSLNARKR